MIKKIGPLQTVQRNDITFCFWILFFVRTLLFSPGRFSLVFSSHLYLVRHRAVRFVLLAEGDIAWWHSGSRSSPSVFSAKAACTSFRVPIIGDGLKTLKYISDRIREILFAFPIPANLRLKWFFIFFISLSLSFFLLFFWSMYSDVLFFALLPWSFVFFCFFCFLLNGLFQSYRNNWIEFFSTILSFLLLKSFFFFFFCVSCPFLRHRLRGFPNDRSQRY